MVDGFVSLIAAGALDGFRSKWFVCMDVRFPVRGKGLPIGFARCR